MSATKDGILRTIRGLTDSSRLRGTKLAKIKELNDAIQIVHREIIEALKILKNPQEYQKELDDINAALSQLAEQLANANYDTQIINAILENANRLLDIRGAIPGLPSSPSVVQAKALMGELTPPPPSYAGAVTGGPPSRGLPSANSGWTSGRGGRGHNGGYKHSKTNSRKYMVKKFRSARNSIRRKKRRRSKTLRRRSTRK